MNGFYRKVISKCLLLSGLNKTGDKFCFDILLELILNYFIYCFLCFKEEFYK